MPPRATATLVKREPQDQDQQAALRHIQAQILRLLVAQHQYIHVAGQGPQAADAQREERCRHQELLAGIDIQAAQQPRIHLPQLVAQGLHQRRRGIEDGADGKACQQQCGVGQTSSYPGQDIDHHGGDATLR